MELEPTTMELAQRVRTGMVHYVVAHTVDPRLCARFEAYMVNHIGHVAATGCFAFGAFERLGQGSYRSIWLAESRSQLDDYQHTHALSLRQDFELKFPEGIAVSRSVSEILTFWEAAPVGLATR